MSADNFRLATALIIMWCLGTSAPGVATGASTWGQSLAVSLTALLLGVTIIATLIPLLLGAKATYNRVTRTTK
tara:strand:+ start:4917 stop:5135 length:219 start_codon:yes stop_codon:yes gene_type:complete